MIGKSQAVLLALLLALPTAFLGAAIVSPAFAQTNHTAWLKIVTSAWKGNPSTGGISPVLPTGTDFAERYNVTNVCVEVYRFKNPRTDHDFTNPNWPRNLLGNLTWEGPVAPVTDRPNGTGFIQIQWPSGWDNLTVIVKARSYQGECISGGTPFSGIIVYWLTVNATERFKHALIGAPFTTIPYGANVTLNDDGLWDIHPTGPGVNFDFNLPRAGYKSGPVDFLDNATGTGYDPKWFAGNFSTPGRAWVARAAYMFKVFHEHTWYGVKDNLTYATIFIYDTDHTDASSTQSLIQAAITGNDGQSRYTREIYPRSAGVGTGKFAQNRLVPIPLQILNLQNRTAFHGGIGAPTSNIPVGAPHLNATKRVWWETVLTNQTFYIGREYNGSNTYISNFGGTVKTAPGFGAFPAVPSTNPTRTQGGITGVPAGPLSIALNHTVTVSSGLDGLPWVTLNQTNVANFNNNTVFYARFCVQDADLAIQHPWIGDKMVGAEVTLNFKTSANAPYYLAHSIHTTGSDGCTDDPHKWPGYLNQYSKFGRFPNGTNWSLRGSLNASYFFNPADDASPAWRPGGYFEQAWGGSWQGPWINAGRNWSALIPEITYMKTRTLSDDPRWGGFEIQVKWKGGSRNGYGGSAVLVDSVRVRNPYGIALTNSTTITRWIAPSVTYGNNSVLIRIHDDTLLTNLLGTGKNVQGPVTLMLSSANPFNVTLQNYNPPADSSSPATYTIQISGFAPYGVTVYIVDNATYVGSLPISPQTIANVHASIKFHDAKTNAYFARVNNLPFLGTSVDTGPDGVTDSSGSIAAGDGVRADGLTGVAEIEFWPGPPGTGTFRFLLSGYNVDFFIFNDYIGGALIRDGFPAPPFNRVFLSFLVASRNALELTPLAPHKAPDIAVARSGHVFITANVHDIAYRLVDNLGNPAPAANTAITLQRGNGPPITKRGADTIPDFFPSTGGLQWSYDQHGEGWAVFYQLPEDLAYMVTVTFDGTPVGEATVDKLTHTIMEDLVLRIYKVKLTFVDCVDSPLSREAFVKVIPPSPATPYVTQLDSTGALDFGYLAGGEYTIDGVWWKGVWVKFTEARIGDRSLSLNPDGSLTFTVDSNIDSPIKLTALINDFIFTTWDFNQDNKIPRLNITLTWVGVHPLTGSRLYFLETMDPTGDTNPVKFNTTKSVSQFLSYRIDHFYGGKSTSRGLKTYADVRYVFYKMPSTFYNITVTTVTTGDPETEQTPGNSKWPGRTVPVDYEIKIDWTGHSSPPSIRKTPAGTVNDRVVLRVYMTMGGQFVTDPSLNPIGNATLYTTCGPVRIDLLTWAHTFYQRIVDGDFDYLNEARRIGNATYHIVNDNGVQMEMYIPEDGVFSTLFVSKWTEDTLLTTWLKADSQHSSNIWWNGSYRKQDLTFYSYVYPLEFTRGEQPWARFYDRVGLTGTGTLTTEDGPMDHDNDPEVTPNSFLINRFFNTSAPRRDNATWPRHNFTVVGNEGLWNQQRWRWEQAVADGLVPEVPTRPYSLVFEKEVVTVPIPVGFITLSLKDEDLARPIPYAVVELSIYTRTSNTDPSGVRYFSAVYKTGRDGNLTLLYPTQEMVENIVSPNAVKNFTLTVFWYLNSSIVYKDAFNLTKRGYSVDKVAIADVTFVLAISANKDRPVKDLYARIWWLNVTDGTTVFPGRITVDHARKTWTYTAVPETRGAAKWTTGQLTLPWLPTSERFTKSDWDLVFDSDLGRWVYDDVTRTWDIPYPSDRNGAPIAGWPYNPQPTGYYRALTFDEDAAIQYRISVWSDQLPIDPSSQDYNNGAWQRDHYELVWRIPAEFPFAWMLFGHPPFDITFYRGSTGVGGFTPIPGYALTRTWTATPSPGSKVVAIKLNATDVEIPVFWQVGDYELGSYDCGPLLGYIVKGRIVPPAGATFGPRTIDAVTTAGTITVGDKTVDVCIAGKPVGLVTVTSGDTPSTVIWGGSSLVIDEVSPPPSIWYNDGTGQAGADNPNRGTTSNYWRNWVSQAIDPITGQPVNLHVGDQLQVPGVDLGIQYMGYGRPYEGVSRVATVEVFSNDPDNRAHRPFIKMFEFQNVSARITDFNGRPLPGAFYQLIDSQTGKSAAWSYAGPDGRIVPMPIRKPGGVFIQRVLYLGQGANGEPTWPVNSFARWPIAYDSRDDETTQETQKPDIPLGFAYTAEAGPWPTGDGWVQADVCRHAGDGSYNYTTSVLEALASCPPAGWGRSFDVITRIFDLRVRFVYGDAQRPADPAYVFSAPSLALSDDFIIRGQGAIFEAKRLARSSYDIVALWPDANGEEVGRRTFDIS
ncbi:MAG: hypothetical protein QW793_07285, partial [Candidatus Caldarchaeum sp.]